MTPVKTNFLIADDDWDDAAMFCEALGQIGTGLNCYKVENGREVFKFLSKPDASKPDVIFLDINMPIMNGWDCLNALKTNDEFKTIPTIIYSTSSARRDVDQAYRLGASVFVTKPEDFKELRNILEVVATTDQDESLLKKLRRFESVKVA